MRIRLDISIFGILSLTLFLSGISFGYGEEQVGITANVPDKIIAGHSFVVEVTINKGKLSSFAKFQQQLPNGMKATPGNSYNAQFSFKDQIIKLIWDRLPDTSTFMICYNISVNANISGKVPITGRFMYEEDNKSNSVTLASTSVNILQKNEHHAGEVVVRPKEKIYEKDNTQIVVFRIQIAASAKQLPIIQLSSRYSISDEIKEENHNNMYKYTIGPFNDFMIAKTTLNRVKMTNGVSDAFLTAYKNNQRISVNHAIRLTK